VICKLPPAATGLSSDAVNFAISVIIIDNQQSEMKISKDLNRKTENNE